jgi:DNA (cytosine-5)-methyltransferase 1
VSVVSPAISAVDLFCGAGGLSLGLRQAGITVVGGIDNDATCRYPFETNIEAPFILKDVNHVRAEHLTPLWRPGTIRLLAGCAPCQPFSPYRRGADTSMEERWPLLAQFGRLVEEAEPDLVTMENVPRMGRAEVFSEFAAGLEEAGYHVAWRSCQGLDFGLPQTRRRLVLVASRLGPIAVPSGSRKGRPPVTVRDTIGSLPAITAGETHKADPLHRSRDLSEINLRRIRASRPGGTWADWPEALRAPCHRRSSGSTFRNVYARMEWDKPSPTITTLSPNFGAGRFGHPDQDRPISLREAAMLQGFPRHYEFVPAGAAIKAQPLARMIGNAVPPPLAAAVGMALTQHVAQRVKAVTP